MCLCVCVCVYIYIYIYIYIYTYTYTHIHTHTHTCVYILIHTKYIHRHILSLPLTARAWPSCTISWSIHNGHCSLHSRYCYMHMYIHTHMNACIYVSTHSPKHKHTHTNTHKIRSRPDVWMRTHGMCVSMHTNCGLVIAYMYTFAYLHKGLTCGDIYIYIHIYIYIYIYTCVYVWWMMYNIQIHTHKYLHKCIFTYVTYVDAYAGPACAATVLRLSWRHSTLLGSDKLKDKTCKMYYVCTCVYMYTGTSRFLCQVLNINSYVFVCACICMYNMYMHIHVWMHMCMNVCGQDLARVVQIFSRSSIYIYLYIYIYTCICIYIYAQSWIIMHTNRSSKTGARLCNTRTHTRAHVCVCVCMCVHVHVCVYLHDHMHTNTDHEKLHTRLSLYIHSFSAIHTILTAWPIHAIRDLYSPCK